MDLTSYRYLIYLELFHLLIQAPIEQVDEIKELSAKGQKIQTPRPPRTAFRQPPLSTKVPLRSPQNTPLDPL